MQSRLSGNKESTLKKSGTKLVECVFRAECSMVTKLAMLQSQRGQKILNRNVCVQCIRVLAWPAAFTGGFAAAFHRKQYREGKGKWHPKEGNPVTWEH